MSNNQKPEVLIEPSSEHLVPLVLTKAQTAEVLCCSQKHLDNLYQRGVLPRIQFGRSIRYNRDSVIAALKALEKRGGRSNKAKARSTNLSPVTT